MNKQVVERREQRAEGGLRLAVAAMLEKPGDVCLSLAQPAHFTEVVGIVADRGEALLVVVPSGAASWAEAFAQCGVAARACGPRDAPPKEPGVVVVGPSWLDHDDHCAWTERVAARVIMRGADAPLRRLRDVPLLCVDVAGEGGGYVPKGARREGYGFSRVRFAVQPVGGAAARQRVVTDWRRDERNVLIRGLPAPAQHLYCAHVPESFAELARWIAAAHADEVTVLFGPEDLLRLQLDVLQQVAPLWPPPTRAVVDVLAWLEGASCRTVMYAAAFGEEAPACGTCEACTGEPAARTEAATSVGDALLAHAFGAAPPADSDAPPLTSAEAVAFETLREWRTRRAREEEIPPYIVFGNATLMALARARPHDRETFLAIKGCGERKWEKFGEEVMSIVSDA